MTGSRDGCAGDEEPGVVAFGGRRVVSASIHWLVNSRRCETGWVSTSLNSRRSFVALDALAQDPEQAKAAAAYLLASGGKRVRPMVVLLKAAARDACARSGCS